VEEALVARETYVVAYDGQDRPVVDAALKLARQTGAGLYVVHVLIWSPYTFLTPSELAERHKHREEELARANSTVLGPILAEIRAAAPDANGEVRHGSPVDVVCAIARERNATLVFVGRSSSLSERVFGSVASGLAQCSPVPTVIVP
jgi:nucleotide-binding universal stress UspA family protein